jgi:hypothetical protein
VSALNTTRFGWSRQLKADLFDSRVSCNIIFPQDSFTRRHSVTVAREVRFRVSSITFNLKISLTSVFFRVTAWAMIRTGMEDPTQIKS